MGVARHLLDQKTPFRGAIGFHAQQAAEKFLKAFLVWHQVEFPKTHDLAELLDLVSSVDQSLADTLDSTTSLTPFGVTIRYPGDPLATLNEKDARDAVNLARSVEEAVTAKIPHSR